MHRRHALGCPLLRRLSDYVPRRRLCRPPRGPLRLGGPRRLAGHAARVGRTAAPRQPGPAGGPAPGPAPPPAAAGHRPAPGPLPRPAPARRGRGLPQPGPERHQPLPRLRHRLRHPPGAALYRRPDRRAPRRAPAAGRPAAAAAGGPGAGPPAGLVAGPRLLQAARYPFLMPLPLRGRQLDHPRGPSGSRVFATWKRSGWARYTLTDAQKRRATVAVCVKCRNRRGERGRHGRQALVYAYGGGLRPASYRWVKEAYRRRFAIETTYRQLGQARIRTCTRNPLLRLLSAALSLILRNVWVWLHWHVLAQRRRGGRRVDTSRLPFRAMLLWLQHWAEDCLGVQDELHTEYPMWT